MILPSVLSEDLPSTKKKIELIQNHCQLIHLDIMDGVFVTRKTPGLKKMLSVVNNEVDVHFMIDKPELILSTITDQKIKRIAFHPESTSNPGKVLEKVPSGIQRGIAINPDTDIGTLKHIYPQIDFVLIMSVVAGAGGQKFIKKTLNKIITVRRNYPELLIEVDGGITFDNIRSVFNAGADDFVVGSSLFNSTNLIFSMNLLSRLTT